MNGRLMFLIALLLLADAATASTQAPASTRVASYNVLADRHGSGWAARRGAVNGFLADGGFDIVAIQEATERQIADIISAQSQFAYVVGERSDGHRSDQGWYEYNPIFYRPDRFTLLDHSSFWVSSTPNLPGTILPETKKHGRVITWARLADRRNGCRLLVVNVHIHGIRGAEEVAILLAELARVHADEPIVLLGDFNFEPSSPGFAELTSAGAFMDSASTAPDGEAGTLIGPSGVTLDGTHGGPKSRKVSGDRRLDYIFTCGFGAVRDYRREFVSLAMPGYFASDHHPVRVDLAGGDKCLLDDGLRPSMP